MKFQVSRNDLANFNVIKVPYGGIPHLLTNYTEPQCYNSGVYGWNYDVYFSPYDTVIVTGYSMSVKGINSKYYKEFEQTAKYILEDSGFTPDEQRINLHSLLETWIRKELNG